MNEICQFFMFLIKEYSIFGIALTMPICRASFYQNTQFLVQIDMTTHRLELYRLSVSVYPASVSLFLTVVHATLRPLLS